MCTLPRSLSLFEVIVLCQESPARTWFISDKSCCRGRRFNLQRKIPMQAHSSPSPELRYKQLPSDLLNLQTQLRVTTEAHAKRNGRLIKRTMSGVNPQIAYRTSPSRPQTAPGHLKGRKRRSTPRASPVKVQYFKANRRKTTPRGGGLCLPK